jgi:hypothetical protein
MISKSSICVGVVFISLSFACNKELKALQTTDNPNPTPVVSKYSNVPPANSISVLTQHNDNSRAGLNNHESILTPAIVSSTSFGMQFSLAVDDQVYAQPLVVSNVKIRDTNHNIVYLATVNNSVYAYDAENGDFIWKKTFSPAGYRPVTNVDMTGACGGSYVDFSGNMGIVGTPVIDSINQTIYFVTRHVNLNGVYKQLLHSLNIKDGTELTGSPIEITATYAGTGDGSVNNVITFNAQKQNQRQALTLLNGIIFISFSSHCDWGPYHGWILGYDAKTLQQKIVYNDTPNGINGGIWESGMGLAADAAGNIYCVTGNGTVGDKGDPTNLTNRGESALKLSVSGNTLKVQSYFTPYNYTYLEQDDLDYGGLGAFLIPNTNLYFTGCKDGNFYILDKDNMGGLTAGKNLIHQTVSTNNSGANMHCQPSYIKTNTKEYVYVWPENEPLRQIPFNRTTMLLDSVGQRTNNNNGPVGQNGGVISVSSNGTIDNTGIVWVAHAVPPYDAEHGVRPGILRAFDANDVSRELWNNNKDASDVAGYYAKFASPTIANGHVYLPTFANQVVVYGIKK